jgi:hypothetical protein
VGIDVVKGHIPEYEGGSTLHTLFLLLTSCHGNVRVQLVRPCSEGQMENECECEGSYSYSGGRSGDTLSSSVVRMKSKRVTNKASTLVIVRLKVKTPSVRLSQL